jgi:tetratricopeptide (TPR) repeat protein
MKTAMLFLLVAACLPRVALADACAEADSQYSRISIELGRSAVEAAERILNQVPPSNAACPSVLLAKARIAAGKGDSSQAEALFSHYMEVAPEDPRGYAFLARLLIDEGEYPRADAASEAAIQKGPDNPAALAVRGQLLAMKGDRKRGVELLTKACQLDPEDAEAEFQLGSIYDRSKLPADAMIHFKRVVALDPEDPRAWDYLALSQEPMGDLDGAAGSYAKALQVNREGPHYDAFLDYNYGRFLMKQGDLKKSKVHLDHAVELVPNIRATWYERARLDLRLKDYQLARKDAETAARISDPEGIIIDLQIYSILEQIYRRVGERELANKYAELGRSTAPPVRGEHH